MRIFPPELEVDDYEGFAQNDIFKRKDFGEGLGNLFANVEDPMVAILDAPWGSGKTTFIKMWCGHMRRKGFPVIYFDAFKNDYMDDAFLAIAGEVIALADDLGQKDALKDFVKIARKVGVAVFKGGGKKLLSKAIGEDGVEDVAKAMASEGANCLMDSLGDYMIAKLEGRKKEQDAFKEFGKTLQDLAEALSKAAPEKAKKKLKEIGKDISHLEQLSEFRPLIFVIDELDRCKPPFALEILEKIKHFFSVPKVHFLLVTHMEQLENSVRFAYGMDKEASAYLQKFYHVVISLPDPHASSSSDLYVGKLFESLGTEKRYFLDNYHEIIAWYSKVKKITFRDQERLATRIALFVAQKKNASTPNPNTHIVIGLCVLKVFNPVLYRSLKHNRLSFKEFCLCFDETNVEERLKEKDEFGEFGEFGEFWGIWARLLGDETLLSKFPELSARGKPFSHESIKMYCNELDSLRF